VQALADAGRDKDGNTVVDCVIGMEARGFILAAPVALALGVGFVPVRKPGKLPSATYSVSYALEYGEATLELHTDAWHPGRQCSWSMTYWPLAGRPLRPPSWSDVVEPRCMRSQYSWNSRSCTAAKLSATST